MKVFMAKKFIVFFIIAVAVIFSFFKLTYRNPNLILYGNVDIRDVTLSFAVPGRIFDLKFDEGDQIKKGDVVAILDKVSYKIDLELKKAQLASAVANLEEAERSYNHQKDLLAQKIGSQKDYDDTESDFSRAKAQKDIAQASLDQANLNISDTQIIALEDGIVMTRIREKGSIVGAGSPVYNVSLQNPVWIRTYIDEPNLGNIYGGQKVLVKTDSGKHYSGKVGFISPQAEFTPKSVETPELRTSLVYRLRIIVENPDKALKHGMPVTIKITKQKHE